MLRLSPFSRRSDALPRRSVLGSVLVAAGIAATSFGITTGGAVGAHGSTADPPSRIYTCRFLQRNSPRCADAWRANPQALYDWMEVNIGNVGGDHRGRIPDGQLCSAGRAKYAAFDVPGDNWPVTNIKRDSNGHTEFVFEATAPHATAYFRYYLTKEGFDPNQPLRWDDLELVHDSGRESAKSVSRFDVNLPDRTGRHILYMIWQRSDSPEAFYSCSDVTIDGNLQPPTTTTTPPPTTAPPSTTAPPTTAPPTTAPPTTALPGDTWSSGAVYVAGDRVIHGGATYVAKWWNRNFPPDTPVRHSWDTPWRLESSPPSTVAATTTTVPATTTTVPATTTTTTVPVTTTTTTTTTTAPPTTTSTAPQWIARKAYSWRDVVQYKGVTYVAKWWSRGFAPDTPVRYSWETPWQRV